jgi:hypothetical protein
MSTDVIVAIIGGAAVGVSAAIGSLVPFRGLKIQRQIESTDQYVKLIAKVHGRSDNSERGVGVTEQVAAVWLVAEFGRHNKFLRKSSRAALEHFLSWHENEDIQVALKSALIYLTTGEKPNRQRVVPAMRNLFARVR